MNDSSAPATNQDEIDRLETRCAELYAHFQHADALAAIAERNNTTDATPLRQYATAWHEDYEAVVNDLHRARGGQPLRYSAAALRKIRANRL